MELPPTCSICGHGFDCSDGVTDPGARPEPGDVSICAACGGLGIWLDANSVRPATADEIAELDQHPGVQAARAAPAVVGDDVHQAVGLARRLVAGRN